MNVTDLHYFLDGIGTPTTTSSSLPYQMVSDKIKNSPEFQKRVMDALESIGVQQLAENAKFSDYYKMIAGDLVRVDYGGEDSLILDQISKITADTGIQSWVKHYDKMGIIFRKLQGEWIKQKDNFRVDSTTDEISQNDFIRERNLAGEKFILEYFQNEIDKFLLKEGIHPDTQAFQSEEEQQQFMQMVEERVNKFIPLEEREREISKNFKTTASVWAEATLENDQVVHRLDELDKQEIMDYSLTGRYFRHFHVGYDHYKPENWSPLETFFSKDVKARYPQDGEYVGRVFYLSVSDVFQRYGHLIPSDKMKNLSTRYAGGSESATNQGMAQKIFGETHQVPFENYYDYDLGLQFQNALGIPMGHTNVDTPAGEQKIPIWLTPFQNQSSLGYGFANNMRTDIEVRDDMVQCTEAYWRSWKKIWFLVYTDKNGISTSEMVTDDLLPEFIKEHDIKKTSKKSLNDLKTKGIEENTMYELWIPEVWQGLKINAGRSGLTEDLYLNVQPLPYQIKGKSNIYEVQLPVCGIIGDSLAKKLRPYQVGYNICMNQVFDLLAKEWGMFFLFDINFIPSEFKNNGTIEDSLEKIQTLAKEVGIVPIDSQKQNIQGAQNMNTFMVQDITFDKQINSRLTMAKFYEQEMLATLGFNPQRLGASTQFETATGVQQGVEAQYDQTLGIFTEMSTARLKAMEVHLAVAQYCQKEYIDADFIFNASDNSKKYINLTDKDFPLRRFGLLPINSPNDRRILENVRNYLMQTNTLGNDLEDAVSLFTSETTLELLAVGKKASANKRKAEQEQRQHEKEIAYNQLQMQLLDKQADRYFEANQRQLDRETKIEAERINALGRASDKKSDSQGFEEINKASQQALDNDRKDKELDVKESLAQHKMQIDEAKLAETARLADIQLENIKVRREAIQASKENSIRNSIDKNLKN